MRTFLSSRFFVLEFGPQPVATPMVVHQAELLGGEDPSSVLARETASLLWLRLFTHEEVTMLAVSQGNAALPCANQGL
jgi:hypothetical protein